MFFIDCFIFLTSLFLDFRFLHFMTIDLSKIIATFINAAKTRVNICIIKAALGKRFFIAERIVFRYNLNFTFNELIIK